jgi:hypothetical protein
MNEKANVVIRVKSPPKVLGNASSLSNERSEDFNVQITITNADFIARRDKYSSSIRKDFDPRDREILIPFQTVFNISKHKR